LQRDNYASLPKDSAKTRGFERIMYLRICLRRRVRRHLAQRSILLSIHREEVEVNGFVSLNLFEVKSYRGRAESAFAPLLV